MAVFLFLVFTALFIVLDLALLRYRSRRTFRKSLKFSPQKSAVVLAVLFFLIITGLLSRSPLVALIVILTVSLFIFYVVVRCRFKYMLPKTVRKKSNPKLILASEALEVFLLWVLWEFIGELIYTLAAQVYPPLRTEIVEDFIQYVFLAIVTTLLIRRFSIQQKILPWRLLTGLSLPKLPFWKVWVLPAILGTVWTAATQLVLSHAPQVETPFDKVVGSIDSFGLFLMFFFGAVIFAPFFEELCFRGFLFAVMEFIWGKRSALFWVAFIFAISHVPQYWGDYAGITMIAILSLLITALRAWTGSIVPGIIAHLFSSLSLMIFALVMFIHHPSYMQFMLKEKRLSFEQKETLLLKGIKEDPKMAEVYNALAWEYASKGRKLDNALVLVNQAVVLEPNNKAFLDTKAEVLYKMGRVKEAVEIEADLVKRNPQTKIYKDHLATYEKALPPLDPFKIDPRHFTL